MKTTIALFRGINVGAHHRLPMGELVEVFQGLGLKKVKTYIQSGNVAFQTGTIGPPELLEGIRAAVHAGHGFTPHVILLGLEQLQRAVAANPFPEAAANPKSLHLYFLDSIPKNPDLETLNALKKENERFHLQGEIFYLHAPDGIGRSKLAARVEAALGVPATARNWRSVAKILAMAEGLD